MKEENEKKRVKKKEEEERKKKKKLESSVKIYLKSNIKKLFVNHTF